MNTGPTLDEAREAVFGRTALDIVKVAYTIDETAAALDRPRKRIQACIQRGFIPARWTGSRYLIAGGVILDLLDTESHGDINDHRQLIHPKAAYTYAELGEWLGIGRRAAWRLANSGRIRMDVQRTHPLISGTALLAWLNGRDEPARLVVPA